MAIVAPVLLQHTHNRELVKISKRLPEVFLERLQELGGDKKSFADGVTQYGVRRQKLSNSISYISGLYSYSCRFDHCHDAIYY